jgi:hypothetical protein
MSKPKGPLSHNGRSIPTLVLLIIILTTITLACSLPFKIVWTGSSETNLEASDQSQTDAAKKFTDETDKNEEGIDNIDQAPSATEEISPTDTPSPSLTPTPTLTPTPEQLTAFIKKNTNCRLGPKDIYSLIHIFTNGDRVNVLAKNQEGTFWFVQDQDGDGIECWIWTEYAETEGNTENLPIITPPPEPPPIMDFVLSHKSTTGETNIHVYVRNTGNLALQSYKATFKDTVTSQTIVVSGNQFGTVAKVSVGNTGVVSSGQFSASTIDHNINVTVKACSEDGQAGKCLSKTISFKSK